MYKYIKNEAIHVHIYETVDNIAPDPIPWVRKGRSTQQSALKMLKKILDLMFQSNDFDYWYGFLVDHFYPQFFHQCTHDYQFLIYPNAKEDDEKTSFVLFFKKKLYMHICVYCSIHKKNKKKQHRRDNENRRGWVWQQWPTRGRTDRID
ncbi:hypothetical protein RFI_08817 [Reticulomyxa filosa]|uniref:Uncharacterized protein n=1 Tax=Reticulomyxa filosa TaxID=46433 RepID=X6NSM3_RETFI|nr:hypothetical protein RFI_08817 [Reticulomyxa filosa]|eukprot:ETO28317.1 hypothetical protein RFI_08817 [Reticulomyxa filosa]